LIVRAEE